MRSNFVHSLIAIVVVAASSLVHAGTIGIGWDAVASSDLAGYRVYYGTSSGSYSEQQDVGLVTSATVKGLTNCSKYYLAVKAVDADGDVSNAFSGEISGYPRPILSSAAPSTLERGVRTTLVVNGANFLAGATLAFADPSVTVHSVTVRSCSQLAADVTVGASAPAGALSIEVRNTDRVYGTAGSLVAVNGTAPPTVLATSPTTGSSDISVGIWPTVTFTRAMLPASIVASNVVLLDAAGRAIPQAPGSPVLSADGRTATIELAADLELESPYRLFVRGGSAGVKAYTGSVMAADFLQSPGFNTQSSYKGLPRVLYAAPLNGTIDAPVNTEAMVYFSEAMDRATMTAANILLVDDVGREIRQAVGSPIAAPNGRSATLRFADDLEHEMGYKIRVLGGEGGVRDAAGDPMPRTFEQAPGWVAVADVTDPPRVTGVTPAEGSTNAQVGVRPVVLFSEAMQLATITPATVSLLDHGGNAVTQRFGSPALSADGRTVTIIPEATLQSGSDYHVRVTGGAGGVRSLAGDAMSATFYQSAGFLTASGSAEGPRVASVAPPSLATGVSRDVRPVVTFTGPMDPDTITSSSVMLLDSAGRAVPQAAGAPFLSSDGLRATIVPASRLAYQSSYKVRVVGGVSGVADLDGATLPATFVQASGFTTVTDHDGPAISSVGVAPEATAAVVTWTTSEAADSHVFYRREVDTLYQLPVEDDLRETSHSLRLVGLAPATQYSFYLESTDATGNTTRSEEGSFTTLDSSYYYMSIEAESGRLTWPVKAAGGSEAFGLSWVDTPQFTPTGRATSPSGKAELSFFAPVSGTWKVWARVYGAGGSLGSWFESIDGGDRRAFSSARSGTWEWIASRSYALEAGMHELELGGLEDQARADRVVITNDPAFVAVEQPSSDTTAPPSPIALTVTPADSRATLRWINPIESDAVKVVLRYSQVSFPTSPWDGYPAATRAVVAGSNDAVLQGGLSNGGTYFFSLFSIDESGNASAPARGVAIPLP